MHRPVHGKIKTVSVKRQCEHWYVCFSVETSVQPLPESEAAVGIDVGLSSFAVLSDGSEIENPRLYQKEQKRLRRAQRRVAFADGIGANAPERLFVTITRFALCKMGMLIGRGIIDPNIM